MKGKPSLEFFPLSTDTKQLMFMSEVPVHAGFPCPVDDAYMRQPINIIETFISNPASSYFVRVSGDSMIDEGIDDGDFLVVDRSITPTEKHVAVCMLDGEFALKRIVQSEGRVFLLAGNKKYKPIELNGEEDFRVYGVVVLILRKRKV